MHSECLLWLMSSFKQAVQRPGPQIISTLRRLLPRHASVTIILCSLVMISWEQTQIMRTQVRFYVLKSPPDTAAGRKSFVSSLSPATVPRAKGRWRAFSAPIPSAPFLFGGRSGAGDGGGPENRHADVYRLVRYLSRPRLCSPSAIVGGVRVCRGNANPWRLAFPGIVGEAEAATAQGNNAPTPPRTGSSSLRFHRRV
jgi:hypothetical protein